MAVLTTFDAWTREESIHTRSKTEVQSMNSLGQMASNTPFFVSIRTQPRNIENGFLSADPQDWLDDHRYMSTNFSLNNHLATSGINSSDSVSILCQMKDPLTRKAKIVDEKIVAIGHSPATVWIFSMVSVL